jgi:hypothetical protein
MRNISAGTGAAKCRQPRFAALQWELPIPIGNVGRDAASRRVSRTLLNHLRHRTKVRSSTCPDRPTTLKTPHYCPWPTSRADRFGKADKRSRSQPQRRPRGSVSPNVCRTRPLSVGVGLRQRLGSIESSLPHHSSKKLRSAGVSCCDLDPKGASRRTLTGPSRSSHRINETAETPHRHEY